MFCISGSLMFVAVVAPSVVSRCRCSQSSRQCRLECPVSCCMLGPRPHSLSSHLGPARNNVEVFVHLYSDLSWKRQTGEYTLLGICMYVGYASVLTAVEYYASVSLINGGFIQPSVA